MFLSKENDHLETECMQEVSVKRDQDGHFILHKDGIAAPCPHVAPIPTRNIAGQVGYMRLPCNSSCPLAGVVEQYDSGSGISKHLYVVGCGTQRIGYEITIPEPDAIPKTDEIDEKVVSIIRP